jgi:hypothetical protein
MPSTRLERTIAAAGLLLTVLLVSLLVPSWLDYRDGRAAASAEIDRLRVETPVAAVPAPAPTRAATVPRAGAARTSATVRRAPTGPAHVVFDATGGSCWLLVRDGSSSGTTLYEGTLDPGSRVTFTRGRLWVRIGAGENLAITVNGKTVDGLPGGVVNVVATRSGVRPA